jgi:hypothetical protein
MPRYRDAAEAMNQALRPRGPFPSMGSGSTSDSEFQRYVDTLGQMAPTAGVPMPPPRAFPGGAGSGSTTEMEQRAYQRYMETMRKLQQAEQQPDAGTGPPADPGGMGPPPGPPADYTTMEGDPAFSRRVAEQNRANMMRNRMMGVSAPIRKFLRGMEEKTR